MSEYKDKMELKFQLNDSCKTAEKFVDIYYQKVDSNRSKIRKMYLEQATLTWNGNPIKGTFNILKHSHPNLNPSPRPTHNSASIFLCDISLGQQTSSKIHS